MKNAVRELFTLEKLSAKNSCVHRINPLAKLLATIVFIVTVVSFDRYSFARLVPYVFFPTLLTALSETPYAVLLKRFLVALPFCLFAGAATVIFDRETAFTIGGIPLSYGLVSFFTILLRVYLCVMAVLVLVSVTPLSQIVNSMRRLKVPHVFLVVFEMTCRYIGVLFEEVYSMFTAYSLRSCTRAGKGIAIRDMGSFAGQLLIRSFDRADRVYNAMNCRAYTPGFTPGFALQKPGKAAKSGLVFFTITCFFCLVFRFVDVNSLFAGISGGLH